MNSGFYDHQIIVYEATAEVTSSPQAPQLIAHGNIVFHIVGSDGVTPTVQCARLLAPCLTIPRAATCSTSFPLKWDTVVEPGTFRSFTGSRESLPLSSARTTTSMQRSPPASEP